MRARRAMKTSSLVTRKGRRRSRHSNTPHNITHPAPHANFDLNACLQGMNHPVKMPCCFAVLAMLKQASHPPPPSCHHNPHHTTPHTYHTAWHRHSNRHAPHRPRYPPRSGASSWVTKVPSIRSALMVSLTIIPTLPHPLLLSPQALPSSRHNYKDTGIK